MIYPRKRCAKVHLVDLTCDNMLSLLPTIAGVKCHSSIIGVVLKQTNEGAKSFARKLQHCGGENSSQRLVRVTFSVNSLGRCFLYYSVVLVTSMIDTEVIWRMITNQISSSDASDVFKFQLRQRFRQPEDITFFGESLLVSGAIQTKLSYSTALVVCGTTKTGLAYICRFCHLFCPPSTRS